MHTFVLHIKLCTIAQKNVHRKLLLKSNTNNINRFNIGTFVANIKGVRVQGSVVRSQKPGIRDLWSGLKGRGELLEL